MTFEAILQEDMRLRPFNSARYLRGFKKRPHISKSKMDSYAGCRYLQLGEFFSRKDYDQAANRYVCAQALVYDTLMSVYDVNTRAAAAARFMEFNTVQARFSAFAKSLRKPNIEVRVTGKQNGQDPSQVYQISDFLADNKLSLFEVDLFGTDRRHIAIDIDTGMSFNVLLGDRIYKPGELANSLTIEQFERGLRGEPANK